MNLKILNGIEMEAGRAILGGHVTENMVERKEGRAILTMLCAGALFGPILSLF